MYIKKIHIENFKKFKGSFNLELNDDLNIIVGNNEAGKSTVIEAIFIALTGMFRGKYLRNELSQYLFNKDIVKDYISSVKAGNAQKPPKVLIEVYFGGKDAPALFNGSHNSENSNDCGVRFEIEFNEKYNDEYNSIIENSIKLKSLPIEYYDIVWTSFAWDNITSRSIPLKVALIDSESGKLPNGSDIYISRIVKNSLETDDIVKITQAFRSLQDDFSDNPSVSDINKNLKNTSKITNKEIEISVDMSSRNAWESFLMTYLDDIPFTYIGKGEQAIIKTNLALGNKKASTAGVVLVEEPENHLSHTKMNELISYIRKHCSGKQVIISTHSSFVANKLGLSKLLLLNGSNVLKLSELSATTEAYFESLPGYNTLRLILCKKAILVEGPSDELVVQRAYLDKHGHLPIEDSIDVISAYNLSFLRFLEIADKLALNVYVVTDNDGDVSALQNKYAAYLNRSNIKICFDSNVDSFPTEIEGKPYNCNTLEPKLLKSNSLQIFNSVLSKSFSKDEDLLKYMKSNKTDCALAIFKSKTKINYPQYILNAIQ
mgnify:FL=1